MIKGLTHPEGITVINIYAPKIRAPKYLKHKLKKMEKK